MPAPPKNITLLTGGVGGAKLALGLYEILPADSLRIIVNTGDDFEHLGLTICPDIDTLMYTLSKQANTETGWGLRNETWDFMDALGALKGPDWFRLGDRDLATHIRRRELLLSGSSLSEATAELFTAASIAAVATPMSDDPVRTRIKSDTQDYDFQNYFVRLKAAPVARGFSYDGHDTAEISPSAASALEPAFADAIVIAPSNPWLSIDPILSLSDIKTRIRNNPAPVIAVSPIVGGRAIKGPAAKLMRELNMEVSALSIARHYGELIDALIIDNADADQRNAIELLGLRVGVTNTVMNTLQEKTSLARFTLEFAGDISRSLQTESRS
jgi:LPPG:FO 2-phospho-L-lactate transferase